MCMIIARTPEFYDEKPEYITCIMCKGEQICPECLGSGKDICDLCDGYGTSANSEMTTCTDCNGTGMLYNCVRCNGNGSCLNCNGYGTTLLVTKNLNQIYGYTQSPTLDINTLVYKNNYIIQILDNEGQPL